MTILSKRAILATALLLGSGATVPSWSQSVSAEATDIEWIASGTPTPGDAPNLKVHYGSSSSSLVLDSAEPDLAEASAALGSASDSVTFAIEREPGVLTCRGSLDRPYDGSGTCAFAPDAAFEASLRSRSLVPKRLADLLTMALVDVDLALIDGLTRRGLVPRAIDDVIAAAALHVTPDYVSRLNSAGLTLKSIDDAIACRALEIDEAYVRGIVAAGYQPSARELIAMKATGITPEYAQKMNAAAQN